jgi:mannose-6-phosphate isomerase-like protein (cupin superfamily)
MAGHETKQLPANRDAVAPDGSDVRILLSLSGGGMAHFELAPEQTSVAVRHRTVEEIWYILGGSGLMWRSASGDVTQAPVELEPGLCITIPCGTHFQFRSAAGHPLRALGVTMPPWPGDGEAIRSSGPWPPTVQGSSTVASR